MAQFTDAQVRKVTNKKRGVNAGSGVRWSDSQRLEAVQSYLMLGSTRAAGAALKIPEITIKVWRTQAWWKDLEAELKLQDELQLGARLKSIAEKSFSVVEDRLVNGNFIYDQKTGKLRRVPVNLKDAHKVAVDSIVQKDLIAGKNVEKANDGQIEDKLLKLAEKFAEMAAKRFVEIKDEERTIELVEEVEDIPHTIDDSELEDELEDNPLRPRATPVTAHVERPDHVSKQVILLEDLAEQQRRKKTNAVHDQRAPRLQEGEPAVQQQALGTEEAQ